MKLAVDAATDTAEPTAWTHVQLGKLYFNHGRYADAVREYRLANFAFPSYAYGLDALAQAEAALGNYRRAIVLERQAVDLIPLPQYAAALGDLYRVTGHPGSAQRQYALIGAIERLLRANGVKTDLEIALFDVDHGIALRHALELARIGQHDRPSIDGDDVLGWALARNGQCARGAALLEACAPARHAGRAQVLPPRDDRALPRPPARPRRLVPPGARAQPAVLADLEPRWRRSTRDEEARCWPFSSLVAALAFVGERRRAPARQLHRSTATAGSSRRATGSTSLYVLDMAEIPTFQAKSEVDVEGRGGLRRGARPGRSRAHVDVTVGGRPVALAPLPATCSPSRPARQGCGRRGSRCCSPRRRSPRGGKLVYRDRNYAGRIGWKEIVVQPRPGARARPRSSAPSSSVSDELLAYPKNLLQSPLDVDRGHGAASRRARGAGSPPTLLPRSVLEQRVGVRAVADGGFAA